jgi:uncharacterized short protein YbdD (DUF466 family)
MSLMHQIRNFWDYLRQVSGDDAYERYLAHRQIAHAGEEAPLTRPQFFKQRQEEKWGRVSRCC